MSYLLLHQESAQLRSFARPAIDCRALVAELSLSVDARSFKALLQDDQDAFLEHSIAHVAIRRGANRVPFADSVREEVEFDIRDYSFDASPQAIII